MKTNFVSFLLSLFLFFSSPANGQSPLAVPFSMAGRHLIIVELLADGRPGAFILDTGAGDILLNEHYFAALKTGEEVFEDINGQGFRLQTGWVHLQLGDLLRKNEKAFIVDLGSLEKVLGRTIHGKIGTHFFRDTELEIDYAARRLTIYLLDRQGEPLATPGSRPEAVMTLELKMKGHIPYLTTEVDGKPLRLGLDTGAEVNVLSSRGDERLDARLLQPRQIAVWAVGDRPTVADVRQLVQFEIGGLEYAPMPTVVFHRLPFNDHLPGPRLDGILGYPFLRHHLTAINFVKREVAFRELRQGAKKKTVLVENRRTEEPKN